MVHRIDKTLLLDEFDVQKYLTIETNNQWSWLKKFFYKNIVGSSNSMVSKDRFFMVILAFSYNL